MNGNSQDLSPASRPHHSEADGVPAPMSQRACRVAGTAAGAAVGSAFGVFAGPAGIVAGAVIGAALSMLSKATADRETLAAGERDKELDAAIGISGGEMGASPSSKRLPAPLGFDEVIEAIAEESEIPFAYESLPPPMLMAA